MSINGPLKISQLPVITSLNGTEKFPAINTSIDGTFQNVLIPTSVLQAGITPALSGLTDVSVSAPSNGQSLTFSTSDSKWHNSTLTSGSLVKLSSGSFDTSVASGIFDLRSAVTNDTYVKVIIELSNIASTGASGSDYFSIKFAQQGIINSGSNYNSSHAAGGGGPGFFTGNFNQAPGSVTRLIADTGGADFSDGGGSIELYNFCRTGRKPPRVSFDLLAYIANGTITSEIGYTGVGQIWGSGGDDTKITDGLAFIKSGFTKVTFDYIIYGVLQ